jgi:hypothetical protein
MVFIFSCNNKADYINMSEQQILKIKGPPDDFQIIKLDKSNYNNIYEYQYGLLKKLSPIDTHLIIKEYIFRKKDLIMAIWFKEINNKWIVIDYLEWDRTKTKF